MTFDLRHIIRSTHRELAVLSSQCACNALRYRRFTSARRTHEAKHFSRDVALQLSHCNELQNAVFDVFQSIVIIIQHLSGPCYVHLVLALTFPGKVDHPVDIILSHFELRVLNVREGQSLQLLFDSLCFIPIP